MPRNSRTAPAAAKLDGRMIQAVPRSSRARTSNTRWWSARITVESDPAVTVFKYPVEFVVDVSDAPEMQEWIDKAARICTREYPLLCEDLKSDGWTPRRVIQMRLTSSYRGVAATSGGRITGSVKYFKSHADDFGAMVHETVHTIQGLGRGNNPGWLVEGIADYERFFKYEPGKAGPVDPDRSHYDGSYRVTATFLNFVSEKYDKELVRQAQRARMREEILGRRLRGDHGQDAEGVGRRVAGDAEEVTRLDCV